MCHDDNGFQYLTEKFGAEITLLNSKASILIVLQIRELMHVCELRMRLNRPDLSSW